MDITSLSLILAVIILLVIITVMTNKLNAFRNAIAESQKGTVAQLQKIDLLEQEEKKKSDLFSQQEKQITDLRQELQRLHQERESGKLADEARKKIFDELKNQTQEQEKQKQLLQEQILKLQQENEAVTQKWESELSARRSSETALHNTEEQLRAKIETMELFAAEQKETIAALNQQLNEKDRSGEQLLSSLRALTENNETASTELQKTIEELYGTIQQLQKKNSELQGTIDHLTMTYNTEMAGRLGAEQSSENFQNTITALHAELQTLREQLSEEHTKHQTTESALQESKERLYGVIKELEQKNNATQNRYEAERARTEELRASTATLHTQLEQLDRSIQNVIAHVPIGCCLLDDTGAVLDINDTLCLLHDSQKSSLLGESFSIFFSENEREFFLEQWKNQENKAEQFRGDAVIHSAGGESIPVYFEIVSVPSSSSMRHIGFFLDKTKEIEAENHLRIATERENELHELKSRFIAMVTNQLRTSLVTIASNTELLERFIDKWSSERRYQAFYRINESLKEMKDLLHDVVFTTKAAAGNISFSPTIINLEELSQAVAKQVQHDLESQHRFLFIEQGVLNAVRLDGELIQTILYNLLSNAFKYSPNGSDVILHAERKENSCVLIVEDHGIGIPALDQAHLFKTFFRGSNVGNMFGTGLGLTIVQQCVQIHNGTLTIESTLHKGTKVTVTLPVAES